MITMNVVMAVILAVLPPAPQPQGEQQVQLYYSQMVPNGSK
jgi:hypothetical protein